MKLDEIKCCDNQDLILFRYKISNGKFQLRGFCKSCGEIPIRNLKFSLISQSLFNSLPIRENDQIKNYLVPFRKAKYKIEKINKSTEWWNDYNQYLKSDLWNKIRKKIIKRDDKLCRICGRKGHEVHHLTYERVKHELPEDLVLLCHSCHTQIHNK